MILSCPNCATRFLLDASRLGSHGRTVRCARCSHTWFAPAPVAEDMPPSPAENQDILGRDLENGSAGADQTGADDAAEPREAAARLDRAPDSPADYRRRFQGGIKPDHSNLPALRRDDRLGKILGWAGLAVFVLIIGGGILLFPRQITTAWPPARTLYATLGITIDSTVPASGATGDAVSLDKRLSFSGLTPSQRFIDGVLTLVITGEIRNIGTTSQTVPLVEVVLLDGKKLDLKTWVFATDQKVIEPGQVIPFETKLENPPAEAQDIRVTFVAGAS